jgi:ankyrin repeat protein
LHSKGADISAQDNDAIIWACANGHLEVAQWLHSLGSNISAKDNNAIIWTCINGHLDVAQWLHSHGANISDKNNDAIIHACVYGHLDVAQWFHSHGADISAQYNTAIIYACANGHLAVAQWLYSLGADILAQDNKAIILACQYDGAVGVRSPIVEWLIDIHYKYGGYIQFDSYERFTNEIKNLLIDNNLINPSTLSENDLAYYLARTGNVVPPDFTTTHTRFTVKYRGNHTKTAPRE